MTGHLDTFEAHCNSSLIAPEAVCYDTENGVASSHFSEAFAARNVIEGGRGCEFLEVAEWVEEEKIVKRILHCVAIGLFMLAASCQPVAQPRSAEIEAVVDKVDAAIVRMEEAVAELEAAAEKTEAPAEETAERAPMQADVDDFAIALAMTDEEGMDPEEYKNLLLSYNVCMDFNREHTERVAGLTPGQKDAATLYILFFHATIAGMGYADDSAFDDKDWSHRFKAMMNALALCLDQIQKARDGSQ